MHAHAAAGPRAFGAAASTLLQPTGLCERGPCISRHVFVSLRVSSAQLTGHVRMRDHEDATAEVVHVHAPVDILDRMGHLSSSHVSLQHDAPAPGLALRGCATGRGHGADAAACVTACGSRGT